jgi:glutathione S-transferase
MSNKLLLNTFSPEFNIPDLSPFPIKVMMFMRMHDLDFETITGDPRKAPLQKIPFLVHKDKEIPDSELILDYLEKEFQLTDLAGLTSEQHAQGHFLCRALEERTYWAIVRYRWFGEKSAPIMRDLFLKSLPVFLRGFVFKQIQKKLKDNLDGQGLGRHSESTVREFMRKDYQALSVMLGDKDYLFGSKPSKYDCTAVAFSAMLATEGLPTNAPNVLEEFPNLKAYWERAKSAYFIF